jgi:hypothetical protein
MKVNRLICCIRHSAEVLFCKYKIIKKASIINVYSGTNGWIYYNVFQITDTPPIYIKKESHEIQRIY